LREESIDMPLYALLVVIAVGLRALAGAVYTNDTEEVAYGFRVIFEAPVTITAYAPIFPDQ